MPPIPEQSIINLDSDSAIKCISINSEGIWYTSEHQTDLKKMKYLVENNSFNLIKKNGILKFVDITKMSVVNKSSKLELYSINKKGKEKSITIDFSDNEKAMTTMRSFSLKGDFHEEIVKEKRINAITSHSFGFVISLLSLWLVGFADVDKDLEPGSTSRGKQKLFSFIIKYLRDTLGKNTVIALCCLITLYYLYKLVHRLIYPRNEFVYTRSKL